MGDNKSCKLTDGLRISTASSSAMPVIITMAYLFWKGISIDWLPALLCLLSAMAFQAAYNCLCLNRIVSAILFAVAAAGGATLAVICPQPMLWIVLAGVLLTAIYPPIRKNVLGEVDILVMSSLLPALGTAVACSGTMNWKVLLVALPVGVITSGIRLATLTIHLSEDMKNGNRSFVSAIGRKAAAYIYYTEMMLPFVWLALLSMAYILPVYTVFTFIAFPIAMACARSMTKSVTGGDEMICDLDMRTANLHRIFSILLTVSLMLAALI